MLNFLSYVIMDLVLLQWDCNESRSSMNTCYNCHGLVPHIREYRIDPRKSVSKYIFDAKSVHIISNHNKTLGAVTSHHFAELLAILSFLSHEIGPMSVIP